MTQSDTSLGPSSCTLHLHDTNTNRPAQRDQVKHHLVLVKVAMQLLEVFVLPLHRPVEVAMCEPHCVQRADVDLQRVQ